MQQDNIEHKIERAIVLIDKLELEDILYKLPPELKDLRNKVMYIHARIEAGLEWMLLDDIFDQKTRPFNAIESARNLLNTAPIFDNMEFVPKVVACTEKHLLVGKEPEKIYAVNNLRKYFSHPTAYREKIKELNLRPKYLEALNILLIGLQTLMIVMHRENS